MTAEKQKALFNKHRSLFPTSIETPQDPMFFGIECGDGWYYILDDLFTKIEHADLPEWFCLIQVKEKFGALRVYTSTSTEEIDNLIDAYEELSTRVCESCGGPAMVESVGGWYATLCNECSKL